MPRAVVYSHWYFPRYVGGGERLAQLTAAGLQDHRVETVVVTTGPEAGAYAYDETPVHVIPRDAGARPRALLALLEKLRPRFVHMVGAWNVNEVGAAARRVGAGFGVAGLDYGQFCDNHRLVRGSQRLCDGRKSASDCFRCTLEGHRPRDRWLGHLGNSVSETGAALLARSGKRVLGRPIGAQLEWGRQFLSRERDRRQAADKVDVFVAPTRFAVERTQSHLAAQTLCEQLMYPVADELLRPEPKRTPEDRLVIGFVGRALRMKGMHVLLEAASRLAGMIPLAVHIETATNDGEEREYWQPIKNHVAGRPDVQWREGGVLDSDGLRAFHAGIDVLVVPSLWPEYLGFVTLEALALGTPVVLSDFPPQRELLTSRESGDVTPPGDVSALVHVLQRHWRRKQEKRTVVTQTPALSASQYAGRLLALYTRALKGAA